MKKMMAMVLAAVLGVQSFAAAAAWHGFGGGHFNTQSQWQRQRPNQGGGFQRPPQRDFRPPQRAPERPPYGGGRMTDEDRRNLHRDLDRANRELYKGR